jgi:membrane protease YdiL (CAAX protease family)
MPTENLADLAYAPFQWSVIKKPEVWAGIAATIGLAIGALYLSGNVEPASVIRSDMPYLALPKAVGEEAFFRGFLQSALSEPCTPWGGIALSSVAFGAAHIRNAFDLPPDSRGGYYTFGIPLITGLGIYYGWLTYKNHSLKESVAVHTWYNFIVMMTSTWIAHRAAIGNQGFSIAIPF